MQWPTTLFPRDYTAAREQFREAAANLGCELEAHSIDQAGPDGTELTIDVAILPGARPDRTLVISGGLHGVEGFLGSAVQLGMLRERAGGEDPGVRCVLLHALNPYGYAWRRRVNETNVDVNRNLLLEGESFSGSPQGYAKLDPLMNPKKPPSPMEPVALKLLLAIARYGVPALKQSVASGQSDYPQGLFFGGERPSRTSEILASHFDRWLADSREVLHLDFHTGLGVWGEYKLLVDSPVGETHRQRLGRWFGPDSFESDHAQGVAYTTGGSFGRWGMARSRGRDYLYAAAEFGTYRATRVLAGLREENQAHHWGRPEDPSTEQAKQQLVELFCPRSEGWREKVLQRSQELVHRAIAGLAGDRNSHPQESTTP